MCDIFIVLIAVYLCVWEEIYFSTITQPQLEIILQIEKYFNNMKELRFQSTILIIFLSNQQITS